MAAVWVLLAKAKYGASLIESSREHGVRPVVVPFDLAAEFLPVASKQADEALAHLVQGLPSAAPEFASIIHRCNAMKRVVAMAQRLAQRDLPVLIQGESGTGKELFARAIHASSKRKDAPFIAVNCGAIPLELIDSELFGHEKALSPALMPVALVTSRRPMVGRFFWMKSVSCRCRHKFGCFVCFKSMR
jgi:DNA-binding NtrC family response regulator